MTRSQMAYHIGLFMLNYIYVPRKKKIYDDPNGRHHVKGYVFSKHSHSGKTHSKAYGTVYYDSHQNRMRKPNNLDEFKQYYSNSSRIGRQNMLDLTSAFASIFDRLRNINRPF